MIGLVFGNTVAAYLNAVLRDDSFIYIEIASNFGSFNIDINIAGI